MRSPLLTLGDRVRLARLGLRLATVRWDGVRDVPENGRSAEQELRARGFSDRAIEAFFRPFLAGIRLRRDLGVSAAVALFDLRMLLRGRAALPARGMRALPEALAHALPAELVRLQTPVLHLIHDASGRVVGVRTPDAELRGSAVVLATDADTTARLTGLDVPRVELGSATLYLAGQQRPFTQKLLVLNALLRCVRQRRDAAHQYRAGVCAQGLALAGRARAGGKRSGRPDHRDTCASRPAALVPAR